MSQDKFVIRYQNMPDVERSSSKTMAAYLEGEEKAWSQLAGNVADADAALQIHSYNRSFSPETLKTAFGILKAALNDPGAFSRINGTSIRRQTVEDRGPQCTLLVYIDDATSELMHLRMVESEGTFAYMEATRAYIDAHGKPVAFYSDIGFERARGHMVLHAMFGEGLSRWPDRRGRDRQRAALQIGVRDAAGVPELKEHLAVAIVTIVPRQQGKE